MVNKTSRYRLAALALANSLLLSAPQFAAEARHGEGGGGGGGGGGPAQAQMQAQQQAAQQAAQQQAQAAARAQQEQMHAQQQQMQQQQQAAQRAQQEQMRAQQQAAQQQAQQAARAQQEQMRAQQQQMRAQQQAEQRAAMEQSRQQQQAEQRAAMEQSRQQQQSERRAAMEQSRQQQQSEQRAAMEQRRQQQADQRAAMEQTRRQQQSDDRAAREQARLQRQQEQEAERQGRDQRRPIATSVPNVGREEREQPRSLHIKPVPLEKAASVPAVVSGDKEAARQFERNVTRHLKAIPASQAPRDRIAVRERARERYLNNFRARIAGQELLINRNNTYVVPATSYPSWYRPRSGWQFAQGFLLGSAIQANMDWLAYGWQPYWGPQPEGFICAADYVPTPWFYNPYEGAWLQPGLATYVSVGPPMDYTGPITVEAVEPERGPFGIMNVLVLYEAFYYPEFGRWGYTNRHGYFVWVDA